jgi:hypothetical protein
MHFPVFAKNFRRPWMKLKNFFSQFPNPWALRVSGMGGYTSKCEKSKNHCTLLYMLLQAKTSVGDPDPDPQDQHVFGPPGSGSRSTSQRYGSGSFPFSHKCVMQTEKMLDKIEF